MLKFTDKMTNLSSILEIEQKPDIKNLLKVLRNEKPDRYTLFEFFMNDRIYEMITAGIEYKTDDPYAKFKKTADAFRLLGYDYLTIHGNNFSFPIKQADRKARTESLNDSSLIANRRDFNEYPWPDPLAFSTERIDAIRDYIPTDMGIIVPATASVNGGLIRLIGYDNLCYMLYDDPGLVQDIADALGSRLLEYFRMFARNPAVNAMIVNDDWGYNTQTLLPADSLRKYVIPWHKKFVDAIHENGKPAILHSCGNLANVMDDIIDCIGYDAKHSFEDKILPVEDAYGKYGSRIAVMGGIDVDFTARSAPEQVYNRAVSMLEQSEKRGGYALGSGNSIPDYVPAENYFAMISAVIFNR